MEPFQPSLDPGHCPFSVDCVVFGFEKNSLKVLLIQRDEDPYNDWWALPGDLVRLNEDLDTSTRRVLKDLTGLSRIFMEQFYTFSAVDRHPLGRIITIAYFSLVKVEDYSRLNPSSFARGVRWFDVTEVPALAFDHTDILQKGLVKLQETIKRQPIGFELLPKKFTLPELQRLYETILGIQLDARNFRKKFNSFDLLIKLDEKQQGVTHRAAWLYKFDRKKYKELQRKGMNFEI